MSGYPSRHTPMEVDTLSADDEYLDRKPGNPPDKGDTSDAEEVDTPDPSTSSWQWIFVGIMFVAKVIAVVITFLSAIGDFIACLWRARRTK